MLLEPSLRFFFTKEYTDVGFHKILFMAKFKTQQTNYGYTRSSITTGQFF